MNLFDRGEDNIQYFNFKIIYKERMTKSITVIIFKQSKLIHLFLKWQIFSIKFSFILFIIIEVIPID